MTVNRGKQFEQVVKECFEKVPGVSIDRLHDQTTGYLGSTNICDFIVYKEPYEYYIECKSIHGNTFPLSNITDNQYRGLLEKSKIKGVRCGIMVWWTERDTTRFIPISLIQTLKENNIKSVRYDSSDTHIITVKGQKKRVFFEYDMRTFLQEVEYEYNQLQ